MDETVQDIQRCCIHRLRPPSQPKDTLPDFEQELLSYDYYKYESAYFFQREAYIKEFGREAIKVVRYYADLRWS